ncbi:MAG TPA: cytochrome C oxidase subunit IV family protein [Bryobacteraceae bacterium]|jgi:cytochrome c oxidase subunit 4|nr:cytochrome C oxidase subunit IV family protein [Bryobacteraceae bacterium]
MAHDHHSGGHEEVQDAEHHQEHIVPIGIYVAVFLSLIVLTWVTSGVATLDLGRLNIFVALSIAIVKASLVLLFFMHLKWATRLTKMIVMSGLYWLILLLFIVMMDLWTRGWMGVPGR